MPNAYDTADTGEELYDAQQMLRQYADQVNQLEHDYYEQTRQAWQAVTGEKLPDYTPVDVTADRGLWQSVHGYTDTQYTGTNFVQLATGKSKNGLTLDDLWARSTAGFDDDEWASLTDDVLRRVGRMSTRMTADKDPSGTRWARVPVGPTCGFCIMLAGRGYVYRTAESAGLMRAYHRNCNCDVYPSWGSARLEGYDQEGMNSRYRQCRATLSMLLNHDEYERQMRSLPGNMKRPSYDLWELRMIAEEMDRRDHQWLYDGTIPTVKWEKSRETLMHETPRDLPVIEALVRNGFDVIVRAETAPRNYSNPDLDINGRPVEIKSPTSSNPRNIEEAVRDAKKQFYKHWPDPIANMNVIYNGINVDINDDQIALELEKQAYKHGVMTVYQLRKDGKIKKIR